MPGKGIFCLIRQFLAKHWRLSELFIAVCVLSSNKLLPCLSINFRRVSYFFPQWAFVLVVFNFSTCHCCYFNYWISGCHIRWSFIHFLGCLFRWSLTSQIITYWLINNWVIKCYQKSMNLFLWSLLYIKKSINFHRLLFDPEETTRNVCLDTFFNQIPAW